MKTETESVIGVFVDVAQAQNAAAELRSEGFKAQEPAEETQGILVRVPAAVADVARVREILTRCGAVDVEHRTAKGILKEIVGHDPGAEPLSADEIRREQEHYGPERDPAYEWENMNEKERQHAAPPEPGTVWPHKTPFDEGDA